MSRFTGATAASGAAAFIVASLALVSSSVNAQATGNCISLKGSQQCPSFQDAYINPTNLSGAWPWFAQVNDVASFDEQFEQYFQDPTRFTAEKLGRQLQCNRTGAASTTLQWERTILCGQFSQISYSAECNVANRAEAIMVCQDTCLSYADSQSTLVNNAAICAPDADIGTARNATRYATLLRDYVSCTDWTTLVSLDNATCIEGASNEGNCGYGPGVSTQLCEVCDPSGNRTIPACCFDRNTQLGLCASYGHPGAALVLATTSVQTGFATSTGVSSPTSASSNNDGASTLTSGQLAGIIVGCIAGALLLGALLAFLIFGRRRKNKNNAGNAAVYGGAAAASHSRAGDKAWANSEDGLHGSMDAGEKSGPSPVGGASVGTAGTAATVGAGAGAGAGALMAASDRPISGVTTQSGGTDGRGTTVAAVRDQYTGQDMVAGEEVVAIYPYNASLNDEITLEPDQRVTLVRLYDDGWALGRTADGQEGALPLVCVSSAKGELPRAAGNGSSSGMTTTTSDSEGGAYTTENERTDAYASATEGGFMSDAPSVASRRP